MSTVVNLESFQDRFKSGLLYSMLEGLNFDESLTLRGKDNFDGFLKELNEAAIDNLVFDQPVHNSGVWELVIWKKEVLQKASSGCCGMCGGNK